MIVLSSSLVLSEVDEGPEGTPWIGYHNLVTSTNIDATSEDSAHPASNLANPATHLYWQGGENTTLQESITINYTYDDEVDYLGVAKHNFGTIGATLSVWAKSDAGNSPDQPYTQVIQDTVLPDDSPVIFRWEPDIYTHVQLRITYTDDVPQAAVVYMGKLLVLQRSIDVDVHHVPIKYGRRTSVMSGMSESGNFLGRLQLGEHRESVATFEHFEPDWYRENFEPFVDAAQTIPFFFAWHPVTYPLEAGYAWLTKDAEPATSPVTQRCDVTLEMRGVA